MSNIYKHFNDIDVNMDKINSINVELDDITKKRVKKQLRNSIATKNNKLTLKIVISVASIFLLLFSISIFSKNSIIAFAKNIPLVNSLFQNYYSSIGGDFQDYTQVIGETKIDKGYEVTLDEVVMDESTFKLIYTIKCPEKLSTFMGDMSNPFPHTPGKSITLDGEEFVGGAGGSDKIIDDYTAQVIEDYQITKSDIPNYFNIEIDFKKINKLKGDWKFSFHSSKEKISAKITNFTLDREVKIQSSDGKYVNLTFKTISFSPISTAIHVTTHDEFDYSNLIFKDDNGNVIKKDSATMSLTDSVLPGDERTGVYILEPMDKVPKKILVEYKTNDTDQEQVTEFNLN